ncbi:MAG: tetratricopeptide repeat protein, partial [Chitinophagaceae bacterium]
EEIVNYFDEHDNLSEALAAAEIGLEQFPYSVALMIKKADMLLAARQYQRALELLENAALYDNNDINIYILKTDALLALDKPHLAASILEESLQKFDGEERIELLFELADVYDDYEEFDKIFDCLKLILEQDPNNQEALYKICFWTDFVGRNEESILLHKQIIDNFPYNEIAWFNLAAAYQGLKLYEKAIDAYQYAVVIDEKFDYAYRNMGDAFIRIRKYKEAIEVLNKVLELSRPEDVIYEAIGYCYQKIHNYAQARFHYKKASHLNTDDSKLQYKIAFTYMLEKQWQQAIKHLEQAMRIHRNRADYQLALGKCYMNLGRNREAITYFGMVVKQKSKNVAGWEALVNCLIQANLLDEAVEQAKNAYKHSLGKPIFLYYAAAIAFLKGDEKQGMQNLEHALKANIKLLKKFFSISPVSLQNQQIIELVNKYKKNKGK